MCINSLQGIGLGDCRDWLVKSEIRKQAIRKGRFKISGEGLMPKTTGRTFVPPKNLSSIPKVYQLIELVPSQLIRVLPLLKVN